MRWLHWRGTGSFLLLFLFLAGANASTFEKAVSYSESRTLSVQEVEDSGLLLPAYPLQPASQYDAGGQQFFPVQKATAPQIQFLAFFHQAEFNQYIYFPDFRETLYTLLFPYHHFW